MPRQRIESGSLRAFLGRDRGDGVAGRADAGMAGKPMPRREKISTQLISMRGSSRKLATVRGDAMLANKSWWSSRTINVLLGERLGLEVRTAVAISGRGEA